MAIISLLAGSIFGALCGLFSWLFLDASALNAFGLYFTASLVSGVLPIVFVALRGGVAGAQKAVALRS